MLYSNDMPLAEKIRHVAQQIYRADDIVLAATVGSVLKEFEQFCYGGLPICVAKTQYSFSTDASKLGAPTGHTIEVREARLSAGAGFVVAICGDIMVMPGLPRKS